MAKAGQHHNDAADTSKPRGHEKSRGRNHPDRSQQITTGSYKKPETYEKQANEHEDPHREPQSQKNEWNDETRPAPTNDGATRYGHHEEGRRSGSDSNPGRGKGD